MARLIARNGVLKDRDFVLGESQTIGRLSANEIPVEDTRMSRKNSRVYRLGRRWMVEDLGSKNGTFLNGNRIEKAVLTDADELRIGETLFDFVADADLAGDEIVLEEVGGMEVRDRPLSYSPFAKEDATQTSFLWLRQDMGQRDGGFRLLVFLGLLLVAGGLFWLVQMLISGR